MTHTLIKQLESIRTRMQQHSSYEIAKLSGLAPNTVRSIRNGVNLNPTISVLDRINEALEKLEGKS